MNAGASTFREPTALEKFFNRLLGFLVGLGVGPSHIHLLEVRGRKTGKLYMTPVDLLPLNGKRYLVAPRGRTQWVRNAEAAGEIVLKRGRKRERLGLRPLDAAEKPEVLKAYLDSYKKTILLAQNAFAANGNGLPPADAPEELIQAVLRARPLKS